MLFNKVACQRLPLFPFKTIHKLGTVGTDLHSSVYKIIHLCLSTIITLCTTTFCPKWLANLSLSRPYY